MDRKRTLCICDTSEDVKRLRDAVDASTDEFASSIACSLFVDPAVVTDDGTMSSEDSSSDAGRCEGKRQKADIESLATACVSAGREEVEKVVEDLGRSPMIDPVDYGDVEEPLRALMRSFPVLKKIEDGDGVFGYARTFERVGRALLSALGPSRTLALGTSGALAIVNEPGAADGSESPVVASTTLVAVPVKCAITVAARVLPVLGRANGLGDVLCAAAVVGVSSFKSVARDDEMRFLHDKVRTKDVKGFSADMVYKLDPLRLPSCDPPADKCAFVFEHVGRIVSILGDRLYRADDELPFGTEEEKRAALHGVEVYSKAVRILVGGAQKRDRT